MQSTSRSAIDDHGLKMSPLLTIEQTEYTET